MKLDSKVTEIKGIGPKISDRLNDLGIYCVNDLIHYFPRTYLEYSHVEEIYNAKENYIYAFCGRLKAPLKLLYANGKKIIIGKLSDNTGVITVRWFNMPYIKNIIKPGNLIVIYGKVKSNGSSLIIDQGEFFTPEEYQNKLKSLTPVYHLSPGISNNLINKSLQIILNDNEIISELNKSILNDEIIKDMGFCSYQNAIKYMHFPTNREELLKGRRRLVFEEFLLFIITLKFNKINERKKINAEKNKSKIISKNKFSEKLLNSLSYELTNAQKNVWKEIQEDLSGDRFMNRLIQGDVGSGKTIIAVLTMLIVCESGKQAALMAPTEVLAKQHYENITKMLDNAGIKIGITLLTGSIKGKDRNETLRRIEDGSTGIIIGTHALFQEKVNYKNLSLAITDEQHRFGVMQRQIFNEKGENCHILVMSATPIPRTLALILYGNMDISVIDELPQSRLPVKNCVVNTSYRKTAYKFISNQIKEGRQAYIICPMIEESENMEGEDVISYSEKLKKIFPPEIKISYLHGRMKNEMKSSIMQEFYDNHINILVSTTVIEVGVDVKNATVMMVENAERFGLSALHQLRGRVGRGEYQSYCIFVDGKNDKKISDRLKILSESNDGFYIAEEDLKLRGPGEFLGVRQSGLPMFELGDIISDSNELKNASKWSDIILNEDPGLLMKKNIILKESINEYYNKNLTL